MIALNLPHLPRPAAVELMIARQFSARVLEAEQQATHAAASYSLARGPRYEESRQWLLAEIAAANKIVAAFNPGLIVRIGGES